jgi:hypothetical protein
LIRITFIMELKSGDVCEDFELYIWFVLLFQSGHFAVDGTVH